MLRKSAGIARFAVPVFTFMCLLSPANKTIAQQPGRYGPSASERGLEHGTTNFLVVAPSADIAKQVAEEAEIQRKALAKRWLGKEIPDWSQRCPICVRIDSVCGGSSSFNFANCQDIGLRPRMNLQGSVDSILTNVLPHEMTHVVLACHFLKPTARWADEAAAMLSESDQQCARYRNAFRSMPLPRRMYGLDHLLEMTDYPREPKLFYDQSYSIASFLVGLKDRATFLKFIRAGGSDGWAQAAKVHYKFDSLNGLESAWLAWLDKSKNDAATGGE
jgi:hypothetical protein